jgi:hypothetical protein
MNEICPAGDPRRAASVLIFIFALLDILALGIIVPVCPRLVMCFLLRRRKV